MWFKKHNKIKTHHLKTFPLAEKPSACSNGDRVTAVVGCEGTKESEIWRERGVWVYAVVFQAIKPKHSAYYLI